jgi:hypothetical protein
VLERASVAAKAVRSLVFMVVEYTSTRVAATGESFESCGENAMSLPWSTTGFWSYAGELC